MPACLGALRGVQHGVPWQVLRQNPGAGVLASLSFATALLDQRDVGLAAPAIASKTDCRDSGQHDRRAGDAAREMALAEQSARDE